MNFDTKSLGGKSGLRFPPRGPFNGVKFNYWRCMHCDNIPNAPEMTFATVDGYKQHCEFVHAKN